MKMKKMGIIFLAIVISLLLTGCWDRAEINKLAIVMAIGIDKIPGPEPFLVTVQIVNPTTVTKGGGGGGAKPVFYASAKGKTVYDAIKKFSDSSPRHFFFSHVSILVFGDPLARSQGFKQTLDYFARERQFRRSMWVLVAPTTAQEVLHIKLDLEKIPAIGIEGILLESNKISIVELVQRKDFIRDITSKSHAAVISKLDLVSQKTDKTKEQKKKNLQLQGEAVFNKSKLVGYLSDAETRGLLWGLGIMKRGHVIVKCQEHKKENVILDMNSAKSQIIPSFADGKLKVSIEIQTEGIIKEANCTQIDVTEINTIKNLEKLANQQIEQDVKKSILKAQQLKTDIFNFGNLIYRDQPDKWTDLEKNWDQKFSETEVKIHVTSLIRRLGVIGGPLKVGNNE